MNRPTDKCACIVTGTTRGIGKALADEIIARGHALFSISRAADSREGVRRNYQCDLRDAEHLEQVMGRVLNDIPYGDCRKVILINNAGVLKPIKFSEQLSSEEIDAHLQVNLRAPFLLLALFSRATRDFNGERRVINISSGAGRHPYAGWSLYCATKAAMDMMTRCVALENRALANPLHIAAIAPGVVDTDMQNDIQQADSGAFPQRPKFVQLRDSGSLPSAQKVARLILDLDAADQFLPDGLYDLRDVQWQASSPTIRPRTADIAD